MKKRILSIALSILTVFAFVGCGLREEAAKDMIELDTWHFTSGVPNNLITVRHSDKNAVFECSADDGEFWWNNEYCQTAEMVPDDTIYWHPKNMEEGIEETFVNIILTIDREVSGYAVIKVFCLENDSWHNANAMVIKSVAFAGAQKVTRKEVERRMEKIKDQENF